MTDNNFPDDRPGTVRAEHLGRAIAVRGFDEDNELTWWVIDTSNQKLLELGFPNVGEWPIVFGGDA